MQRLSNKCFAPPFSPLFLRNVVNGRLTSVKILTFSDMLMDATPLTYLSAALSSRFARPASQLLCPLALSSGRDAAGSNGSKFRVPHLTFTQTSIIHDRRNAGFAAGKARRSG